MDILGDVGWGVSSFSYTSSIFCFTDIQVYPMIRESFLCLIKRKIYLNENIWLIFTFNLVEIVTAQNQIKGDNSRAKNFAFFAQKI